ncbi:MAG: glycosyltransferase [Lentisphaeria bacterium]|nr:glycosyltransferase [Lentisphaeria bacterium]
MTISVAIAAYRGEKFIGEELNSFAAQTIVPDEVVICDDSPDDLTENEVRKFEKLLNIRYFRNDSQLGVSANFNKVLSLCSGDVVFLADQDDLWYPDKTAKFLQYFEKGAKAVFCDSDITDGFGEKSGLTHFESRGYAGLRSEKSGLWCGQFEASCRRFPAAGHDMALKKELLEKLLPVPDLANCHDNFLGLAAAALDEWVIIPESLGTFRRHGNNTSGAGQKNSLLNAWKAARESAANNSFSWNAKLFQEVLRRLPDLPEERVKILSDRVQHSLNRAEMSKKGLRKYSLILNEIRNGNYFRFGRGWKNVVQDLFLR